MLSKSCFYIRGYSRKSIKAGKGTKRTSNEGDLTAFDDDSLKNLFDKAGVPEEEKQPFIRALKDGIDDAWLALWPHRAFWFLTCFGELPAGINND